MNDATKVPGRIRVPLERPKAVNFWRDGDTGAVMIQEEGKEARRAVLDTSDRLISTGEIRHTWTPFLYLPDEEFRAIVTRIVFLALLWLLWFWLFGGSLVLMFWIFREVAP